MNDEHDRDLAPPRRFVLTIWLEPRDEAGAPAPLRGSIKPIEAVGAADAAGVPRRVYFETLEGIVPALARLLRRAGS